MSLKQHLRSSYIGAIVVAFLLVYSMQQLIAAAADPVSAGIAKAINFVFLHGRLAQAWPLRIQFSWLLSVYNAVLGVALLLISILLGLWLFKQDQRASG